MKCPYCSQEVLQVYTFCHFCGKELNQNESNTSVESTVSTEEIDAKNQKRNQIKVFNAELLRKHSSSRTMLNLIVLLTLLTVLNFFVSIVDLINPIENNLLFGIRLPSVAITIVSMVFSSYPAIILWLIYLHAKHKKAWTSRYFRLIRTFSGIQIRIYQGLAAICIIIVLFTLFRFGFFSAILLILLILLYVPGYFLIVATNELADNLVSAIDIVDFDSMPFPTQVQRWLKWLMIQGGLFIGLILLVILVKPENNPFPNDGYIWYGVLLPMVLNFVAYQFGRQVVDRYAIELYTRVCNDDRH